MKNEAKVEEFIKDEMSLREIELGYRIIADSPWGKIRIYKDTGRWVADAANAAYYRRRTQLLREDTYPMVSELERIFDQKKLWTKDRDKEIVALGESAAVMEKEKSEAKGKRLAEVEASLVEIYAKFWKLVSEKEQLFGETVESQSDAYRRLTLITTAVRYDEVGVTRAEQLKPVFADIDQLIDLDEEKFEILKKYVNQFWADEGVNETFLEESPAAETSSSDGQ